MTLQEKIEQISIDAKQAEQISVMFDIAFTLGIAFHAATGLNPHDEKHDQTKKVFIKASEEMAMLMFDELMKDYEKG